MFGSMITSTVYKPELFPVCLYGLVHDRMLHNTTRDQGLPYRNQGPVSLTFFPSQFKFDGNFVLLSPQLHYRDRYKILYMARQLCCRGMCKNLLRSDGQQRSYGKAKFPSYLNCGQKTVSETGPGPGIGTGDSRHGLRLIGANSCVLSGLELQLHCELQCTATNGNSFHRPPPIRVFVHSNSKLAVVSAVQGDCWRV